MKDKSIAIIPETGEIKPPQPIQLNEAAIQNIQHNIRMAEKLVMEVLEEGVDYGLHPGTNSLALRDPGASKIANAFNTYPEHIILHSREEDDIISYLIQVKLISRNTGEIVAVGIGACSTLEAKYSFRWVENPEDYGYDRTQLRPRKGKFRIPNPEITDLGNTILKMGAKRAEIDACQNLPGVGSALRKLFDKGKKVTEKGEYESPVWQRFWGEVRRLGLTDQEAHAKLGVLSMKDWLSKGHSLDEALNILRGRETEGSEESGEPLTPIEPKLFKNWGELAQAAAKLGVTPSEVFKRGGVKKWEDFSDYRNAWNYVEELVTEKAQKPQML
jgi:hypothetical protein